MFYLNNSSYFQVSQTNHNYSLRTRFNYPLPHHNTDFSNKQLHTDLITIFNALPLGYRVQPN